MTPCPSRPGPTPRSRRSARRGRFIPTSAPGRWPDRDPFTVGKTQAKSRVSFEYADESDRGPYPIPASVKIEGGPASDGDRHALILDRDACRLYELYALRRSDGRWTAGSGAIWNLRSNRLRPSGWTSADAAGLPILPGLARYDEVAKGRIDHALRFTVSHTRRAYVFPARHYASSLTDPVLPAMGPGCASSAVTTFGLSAPGACRPPGAEGLLDDRRRQRLRLVHLGAPDCAGRTTTSTRSAAPGSAFEVVDTSSLR